MRDVTHPDVRSQPPNHSLSFSQGTTNCFVDLLCGFTKLTLFTSGDVDSGCAIGCKGVCHHLADPGASACDEDCFGGFGVRVLGFGWTWGVCVRALVGEAGWGGMAEADVDADFVRS